MQTSVSSNLCCGLTIVNDHVTEVRNIDVRHNASNSDKTFEFFDGVIYHKPSHCFISIKALFEMLHTLFKKATSVTKFYEGFLYEIAEVNFQLIDVVISQELINQIIIAVDNECIYDNPENKFMFALEKLRQLDEEQRQKDIKILALQKKWEE